MNRLVVDASVAVKWFVPEVGSIKAGRLIEIAATLAAPDLIATEVANTLWKKVRRGELQSADAADVLTSLAEVPLTIVPVSGFLPHALDLAVSLGRTVYDSLYLAVAIALDRTLITADRKFFNAVAGSSFADRVRLL